MAIKLNKFVDININYNLSTSSDATRDTAVLIINTISTNKVKTYDSMKSVLDDYKSDSRFDVGGELYYYVYCFFNNGGKKLMIYEKAEKGEKKYDKVTDTTLQFIGVTLYVKTGNTYVPAVPTNSNTNSEPLYEAKTVEGQTTYDETEDPDWISGKTYYMNEAGTTATPYLCGLYTATEIPKEFSDYTEIKDIITSLSNDYIVISSNASWSIMKAVSDSLYNSEEGMNIESKLILSCIDNEVIEQQASDSQETSTPKTVSEILKTLTIESNGFVLKYGTPGVQMAIAAYLTQINANRYNSVQDYYFTTETVQYTIGDEEEKETIGYICDDDKLAEVLLELEINFDSVLVNEVRNLGGNTTKGKDLVNEFMLILVHQTLTERLVQLLTQKIKYNQTGLSLIGATIADELQRYVDNGYLTTDKVWTDPDLVYKGVTIISKNTPLQIGYKYVILPYATLSAEDRKKHTLPSIYILIADSYAIRKIEIDGEVF